MRTKMVISWIFFVVFLGTSKSLFAQTISINIKNATLEETLKKIKQVSGFDMVFKMKDIKDIKKHINLWQKLVLDWKKVNLERYLTKMENLYSGFRLEINPA